MKRAAITIYEGVLNDAGWNSSGEFGRSQVEICDATKENFGLW